MLDTDLISERRRALNLSQRALASRLGVTSPTVQRLENGQNPTAMTVRELSDLADILGVSIRDLFLADDSSPEPVTSSDPLREQVAAALLHSDGLIPQSELAVACNVSLRELQDALRKLDAALRPAGLKVHRTPSGDYGIRPLHQLSRDARQRLQRAHIGRRGLTAPQLRLVQNAVAGPVAEPTSNSDRVAAAGLQKAGLLQVSEGRLALTEAARFSLLLDD